METSIYTCLRPLMTYLCLSKFCVLSQGSPRMIRGSFAASTLKSGYDFTVLAHGRFQNWGDPKLQRKVPLILGNPKPYTSPCLGFRV